MCRGKGIHDSVFGAKSAAMQNTLQRTAWRIDSRVLDVAEKLSEGHKSIGKFLVIERERPEKGNAPEHYLNDAPLSRATPAGALSELPPGEGKKLAIGAMPSAL